MKKIISICLCLSIILLVTGCNKTTDSSSKTKKVKDKGNCKILDCINKIDIKDNLEKVNETMGFEGEKQEEKNDYIIYKWALNDYDSVVVTFYSNTSSIKINFNDNLIQSDKTNFSKFEEISKSLKDGETLNYDDIKKKFKGKGTLIEKSSSLNVYRWVDKTGGYLNVSFNAINGKCSRIKGEI